MTNNYHNDYIKSLLKQIKSKLNVIGEVKLECIDKDGFFGETLLLRDLLNTSLIVVGTNKYFKFLRFKDTHQTLSFNHLKYFKIKEDDLDNFVEQIGLHLFNDGEARLKCIDEHVFFGETLLLRDVFNKSLTVKSMNKQIYPFKLSFDRIEK